MAVQLQRQVFEISRVTEYFTVRELQTQGASDQTITPALCEY
jgi:hypothetical protein